MIVRWLLAVAVYGVAFIAFALAMIVGRFSWLILEWAYGRWGSAGFFVIVCGAPALLVTAIAWPLLAANTAARRCPMSRSGWVHLDVLLIQKETDRAFLLVIDGVDGMVWVPKSQISDPDDYEEGDENVSMSVTEFIAREKGLGD